MASELGPADEGVCVLRLSEAHRTTTSLAAEELVLGPTRRPPGDRAVGRQGDRGLRLVAQTLHPQRPRGRGQLAPDGAVPDDPEPLAAQDVRFEGPGLPAIVRSRWPSSHAGRLRTSMIIAASVYSAIAVAYAPAEFVSRMPCRPRPEWKVLDARGDAVRPADTRSARSGVPTSLRRCRSRPPPALDGVPSTRRWIVVGDQHGAILGRRVELRAIPVEEEAGSATEGIWTTAITLGRA